jgi:hypothetical protein
MGATSSSSLSPGNKKGDPLGRLRTLGYPALDQRISLLAKAEPVFRTAAAAPEIIPGRTVFVVRKWVSR